MHTNLNFGETLNYVRDLKAGNHGVFFYRSPQEKHQVLFNFLQSGFEKGKGAVYVASQETSKQIRRQMENFGLNPKILEKDGVLRIADYYDWYIINGEVNIQHAMESGIRVFDEAAEIGLRGLVGCGEVACFFEHNKEKELVDYELMVGRNFDLPITALCAYDVSHAKSLQEEFFLNLVKAHGPFITSSFAQEVKFETFFPPIMNQTLESVLGEEGKETLLRLLYEHHSITLQNICEDPKSFLRGLEKSLGSGAQILKKSMVRQIYSKIGITSACA